MPNSRPLNSRSFNSKPPGRTGGRSACASPGDAIGHLGVIPFRVHRVDRVRPVWALPLLLRAGIRQDLLTRAPLPSVLIPTARVSDARISGEKTSEENTPVGRWIRCRPPRR